MIWYYLGGITLFFFIVQVCTGILLMLYYRPGAEEAFESVQFLITQVPFGWLIRSIHSWSANLMVAAAFLHLFSVFFLRAYRRPRELTWISGVILLVLAMAFGFSGYLLPWNKLAFFATKVGTDIAGSLPLVGGFMLRFLRGGDQVTGGTLSRFYGWHVAILPAITVGVLLLHLLLVQRLGMSVPPGEEARRKAAGISDPSHGGRQMAFVPNFLLRDLMAWTVALGVLAALAALFPWELGEKADPFAPAYANIRPEWYFMFMFQTLKYVPGGEVMGVEFEAFAILAFMAGGLLLVLVPLLDRDGLSPRGRSVVTVTGIAVVAFMTVMTALGYHSLWPLALVPGLWVLLRVLGALTTPSRQGGEGRP
jgi:cytochrome b6